MSEFIAFFGEHFDYIFLYFMRLSGLMISSPVFGRRNVPNLFKIAFCCMLTFMLVSYAPRQEVFVSYGSTFEYFLIIVRELMFGVCMGFVTTAFFNLSFTAGMLIDNQLGFSMVNVYDIQNNTQVPLVGNMLNVAMLLIFFALDGHLRLLDILCATVERIPIGAAMPLTDIALVAMEVFSLSFSLAIMVAMPVIAAGLILEVCLGVLIKTVPQMNMFVVGIPLKLLVGMLVLAVTTGMFAGFCEDIFLRMFESVEAMFDAFASAV